MLTSILPLVTRLGAPEIADATGRHRTLLVSVLVAVLAAAFALSFATHIVPLALPLWYPRASGRFATW